jgi:type II secretory pathway component PulM
MMDRWSREKKVIAICGVLVVVAFVNIFVVSPSTAKRDRLERSVRNAQGKLEELRMREHEYSQIFNELTRITQQTDRSARSFELGQFLFSTADKLSIARPSIDRSKKQLDRGFVENRAVLKFTSISLENLVTYLYEIEKKGAAVAIADLRIVTNPKQGGLRVDMVVTSIGAT